MEDTWGIFYDSEMSEDDCCYINNIPNYLHDMNIEDQCQWYCSKTKSLKNKCYEILFSENLFRNRLNIEETFIYNNKFTNICIKYFDKILVNFNISKFRIRFDSCSKYVEYLINIKINNNLYGKWIRYSILINIKLDNCKYFETFKFRNFLKYRCRPFRNFEVNYLYNKCFLLESYIYQFLYESDNLEYFIDSLFGKKSYKLIFNIN